MGSEVRVPREEWDRLHRELRAAAGSLDVSSALVRQYVHAALDTCEALRAAPAPAAAGALAREERAHEQTLALRDAYHEAADRLAYALFGVEDIGEHTNLNNPWQNAAELLEGNRDALLAALSAGAGAPAEGEGGAG